MSVPIIRVCNFGHGACITVPVLGGANYHFLHSTEGRRLFDVKILLDAFLRLKEKKIASNYEKCGFHYQVLLYLTPLNQYQEMCVVKKM